MDFQPIVRRNTRLSTDILHVRGRLDDFLSGIVNAKKLREHAGIAESVGQTTPYSLSRERLGNLDPVFIRWFTCS